MCYKFLEVLLTAEYLAHKELAVHAANYEKDRRNDAERELVFYWGGKLNGIREDIELYEAFLGIPKKDE